MGRRHPQGALELEKVIRTEYKGMVHRIERLVGSGDWSLKYIMYLTCRTIILTCRDAVSCTVQNVNSTQNRGTFNFCGPYVFSPA